MLAGPEDFIKGPLPLRRDSPARLTVGFTVCDGSYLSARWPETRTALPPNLPR
jgi:hypothetical protein